MKIDIKVPDGQSGSWKIETFEITQKQAEIYNLQYLFRAENRSVEPGTYKRLSYGGETIMSNTPAEIQDHLPFIQKAKRSRTILITGLGVGVALTAILESNIPEQITVIEKSQDVINLSGPTYQSDPRVKIIHGDAFEYEPDQNYNAVWHDIWPSICADNLEEMDRLYFRYIPYADWQGCWGEDLCEGLAV